MDRHFSIVSMWLQLEICAMAVLLSKGEIRCYCDAPHCVATGYMCKSEVNACFTRSLDPSSPRSLLSHGCYDPLLNSDDICQSGDAFIEAGRGSSALGCCHEDMCNYRGLQELGYGRRETIDQHDRSQQTDGGNGGRHLVARVQEVPSNREVWFRAAVIAVPIAGGLILVLLIVLALRMLRSESRRLRQQRREMLARLHYSFHGHQLKKGTVAKLDLECMVPVTGHENCCLTCDKIRQSSELTGERLLSLVHWGKYGGRGKMEFV